MNATLYLARKPVAAPDRDYHVRIWFCGAAPCLGKEGNGSVAGGYELAYFMYANHAIDPKTTGYTESFFAQYFRPSNETDPPWRGDVTNSTGSRLDRTTVRLLSTRLDRLEPISFIGVEATTRRTDPNYLQDQTGPPCAYDRITNVPEYRFLHEMCDP